MSQWIYRADAELPSYAVAWYDRTGTLIDFSNVGYTFEVKLVDKSAGTVALTKTTGITGAATSPNIIVAWSAGQLAITPSVYKVHLTATLAGNDRHFRPGNEPTITILAAT